jgi:hypothetical protein
MLMSKFQISHQQWHAQKTESPKTTQNEQIKLIYIKKQNLNQKLYQLRLMLATEGENNGHS